jgi:translocation and assembly module TamB
MNDELTSDAPRLPAPDAPQPSPRRLRLLRWALALVLTGSFLIVLLAGLAWYGVSSERGARLLLPRLGALLPGELTVGSQTGPLVGPLELRDVRYRKDGLEVSIQRLALDWDADKLGRRRLDVRRLRAEGIRVVLPPSPGKETETGRLVDIHLPVNVIVRDALIRNVEVIRAGQPPFRLDEIALQGRSLPNSDTLMARNLRAAGPAFTLQAHGRLTPVGDYAVDLEARATYEGPDLPPFAGSGAFHGTLEKLGVDARLARPFTAHVTGSVLAPMRELKMDLTAQVRGFDAQEIDPRWPAARITQGTVKIRGGLDDFHSEGTVAGAYEGYGAAKAAYRLARREGDFIVESLNVETDGGAEFSAKGTVGTGGKELNLDLLADWHRLAWPLQGGSPVLVSRAGEARLRGTPADYRIDVNAELAGPSLPNGRWTLAGRGGKEGMAVRSLRGDVLHGQLVAAGTVAWTPGLTWRVKVSGRGIDPAAQWPQWPGSLAFAATSDGELRDGGPYGRLELTDLGGNLRGNPVAGRVRLELAGNRYRLPRLDLRSGSARLTAAGDFTQDAADLDWRLDAPDLGAALPDAGGSVSAAGKLAGPWKTPRVRARASGESIVFQTYSVENAKLAADVDLASGGPVAIDLDAANVGFGARRLDAVTLHAHGTRRAHDITLAVRAEQGSFDLALAGGLQGLTAWSGEIRRLDLRNEQAGSWSLAKPAALSAGTTDASLRDFCWTSGNARLCGEGRWASTGPWDASGTLTDLPFSLFEPLLPPGLEITGGLNGTFAGRGTAGGFVTASVDLRPGPGEIRYPAKAGETARVRFDQGTLSLRAGEAGVSGRADLTFENTGALHAELRLPQYNAVGLPLQSQTLGGRIEADFTNLGLVEAFVPDLEDPRGNLTADLRLAGTVASPRAVGSIELRNAQADVPKLGLEVRQIALAATSDAAGVLELHGSARSGGGTVTIAGNVPLDERPARITIEGRRFLASATEEARVLVSPRLQIAMQYPRVDVTGDVEIPEAEIRQQKRRAAIPVSEDVVIVPVAEEATATSGPPLALHARVRVILGDKVNVAASGFTGQVTGSLLVNEQPGKATAAVGELEIKNGVYKAYGQDLTLDRGRLIFGGGPLDNPGLDLRAYRKADDGTVAGVTIGGTLNSPQTTLYSDPPMDESEALAYLLLGHPLGQASPQEGDLLANAARSLGLKGGNLVAKKLASRFGLEEARVETTGGFQEASLVVGKYLSPRLYVTYGVGLFEPISTFKIRYLLGRHWTLQAEQGEGTSADLLYTVERGKGGETPVPSRGKGEEVKAPPAETGGAPPS